MESRDTRPPTYRLNPDTESTDQYYRDVADLVDDVIQLGSPVQGLIRSYREFMASRAASNGLTDEEALLELLTLGVLWIARGREAILQSPSQRNLVNEIVRERRKGYAKRQDSSRNALLDFGTPLDFSALQPSTADLKRLADWLLATGEYDDEVLRIEGWLDFLTRTSEFPRGDPLRQLVTLASDFARRAESKLGRYTQGVEPFLLERLPLIRQREDAAQCSRRRVEYHLNLFATEFLNRAWRDEFFACKERVVALSGCLRQRSDQQCRAIRDGLTMRCSHCTKGCLVSSATRLTQRHGATAVAVVHGSDFSRFLRAVQRRGAGTGVIGVACAPGIMGAGLRAKALGIPAQCVVLHSSGCDHWRTDPVHTSFDFSELERLLGGNRRVAVVRYEGLRAC